MRLVGETGQGSDASLEVDDDEGDFVQRGAEVVETALRGAVVREIERLFGHRSRMDERLFVVK